MYNRKAFYLNTFNKKIVVFCFQTIDINNRVNFNLLTKSKQSVCNTP